MKMLSNNDNFVYVTKNEFEIFKTNIHNDIKGVEASIVQFTKELIKNNYINDSIEVKLDEIKLAINGDGPKSIINRLEMLETKENHRSSMQKFIVKSICILVGFLTFVSSINFVEIGKFIVKIFKIYAGS